MKSKSQLATQIKRGGWRITLFSLALILAYVNIGVLVLPATPVSASGTDARAIPETMANTRELSRAMELGDEIGYVGKSFEGTYGIAWGDWDNDGDLDLAVANAMYNEKTRVYENEGGTLVCNPTIGLGWEAPAKYVTMGVAWSDFDDDGDLDLALGNNGTPALVFENEGGTLQLNIATDLGWQANEDGVPVSQATSSIVWGDWDDDGDSDLLVVNQGSHKSRIYENIGNGEFDFDPAGGIGWEAPSTHYSYNAAWGDYDNDGDLDLAFANGNGVLEVYEFDQVAGTLVLNPGSGYGWTTTVVMNTKDVAWGDYNDDGYLDLAVANYPDFYNPGQYLQVYGNNKNGTFSLAWHSASQMASMSIAWGDWDNDGDQDLAVGNNGEPNRVFENDGSTFQFDPGIQLGWQSTGYIQTSQVAWVDWDADGDLDLTAGGSDLNLIYTNHSSNLISGWVDPAHLDTQGIAWGDWDNDGDLDLAAANYSPGPSVINPSVVYENDGGVLKLDLASGFGWKASESWNAYSAAWGDYDNDGDLDLALTDSIGPTRVYENEGGTLQIVPGSLGWISPKTDDCGTSLAWGDWDNDGYLDLAVGGSIHVRVYDNDNGELKLDVAGGYGWQSAVNIGVYSLAWGDWDNDGDLDLATSGVGKPVRIFENDDNLLKLDPVNGFGWATGTSLFSYSVAWGDYNTDGKLDLAVGNFNYYAQVYRNTGSEMALAWESAAIMPSRSVAWGDWDGDDDPDLAVGNPGEVSRVFENLNGELMFDPEKGLGQYFADDEDTYSVAWGDVDNDGDLDLAYGVNAAGNSVLKNQLRGAVNLPNNPPRISVRPPGVNADFYSSADIWQSDSIPIPYTLADPEGDPVRLIKAYYSIDGGGTWSIADPAAYTNTTDLAAPPEGAEYTFNWDPISSNMMGQADNTVIKIEAYPDHSSQSGKLAEINQWPFSTATSMPFRARGIQLRVMDVADPVPGAMVYRLTPGNEPGQAFSDSNGKPYTTDGSGYLQGRGMLENGDELVALALIDQGTGYEVYATNATPMEDGLQGDPANVAGVQYLDVSMGYPLMLFNLTVSLEWDASYDQNYLEQLEYYLGRASSYLYDFTNGQIALGRVQVYQNRDQWESADIKIMASNRLRPWAVIGGIVDSLTNAPYDPDLEFEPGQVSIGSVWNRYGNPGQTIGEDWPIILAHELSHYLFFLDDVYLGIDSGGYLVPVDDCLGSAMGDLYSNPSNTEFIYDNDYWTDYCSNTLGNHTNGRAEWDTLVAWYDHLVKPGAINSGPSLMSYQFTTIEIHDPATSTTPLIDPTFYVQYTNGQQASTSANAYLEKPDLRQINLGSPVGGQNRVIALGAELGDRLCVFDPAFYEFGCDWISAGNDQLNMRQDTSWNPVVSLMPYSVLTPLPRTDYLEIKVQLTQSPGTDDVVVRVFPEVGVPYAAVAMSTSDHYNYTATIMLTEPTASGVVQIYLDEAADPRRETILPYSIGGDPGYSQGGTGSGGRRSGNAPLLSPDGSLIYFSDQDVEFPEGTLFTVQSMSGLPPLPAGRNLIGQAYRIVASPGAVLPDGSVSIQYRQNDLTLSGVVDSDLSMYFYDGGGWQELETTLDEYYNLTSAPAQGQGVYALFASIRVPLLGSVWNSFSYPLRDSNPTGEALTSIDGKYSLVYGYEGSTPDKPWRVYDPHLVSGFNWVNTLAELQFGRGYWIYATQGTTIYFGSPPTESPEVGWLPVTFYGLVNPAQGLTPVAGMTVSARQDGQLKGQGVTQAQGGKIGYALQASVDASSSPVTILISGPWTRMVSDWSSTSTNRLDLPYSSYSSFLPLVIN